MKRKPSIACALLLASVVSACSGAVADDSDGHGANQGALGAGNPSDPNGKPGDDQPNKGDAKGKPGEPGKADPCTGPSKPGDPKSPGDCYTVAADAVCADPENGKLIGAKMCASKGFELTNIAIEKGTCSVTCCAPKSPPPGPSPEACTASPVGDGKTCLSLAELATKADAICSAQKAQVTALYPANDCPNGSTIAKLECCGAPPAKEPPPNEPVPGKK